jgi:hypothetical protein
MSDRAAILDAAQNAVQDAGNIALDAIDATDINVRTFLSHLGISHFGQSCLFGVLLAIVVILMMNQLRNVFKGGILVIASLMAVELIKPAFVAIGARLLLAH